MTTGIFLSRLCGKLLGDGSFTKQTRRKPRFQFQHRVEDIGWTEYCYQQLSDFLPLAAPKYKKTDDLRIVKGYTEVSLFSHEQHQSSRNFINYGTQHIKKSFHFHS